MDQRQKHLLQLVSAKENAELQEIKKTFSNFSKYFFNVRKNITIVYEKSVVYVIHKDYLKIIDLGKVFIITDLVYNYERNYLLFLTTEGHLFLHFASSKSQVHLKKDIKKLFVMEWVYSAHQTMNFFLALQNGVYLYRVQEQKKTAKEVKHLSGKYHCYLYEPISQILVGFQMGDCDEVYLFHFQQQKAKNWFRCGEIQVNIKQDDVIAERIHKKKSFGLQGSTIGKQVFTSKKKLPQDFFIDIQQINHTPYMFFYFSNEGKLQLTPLDNSQKKPITIKLPSDSLPSFNVYDNMLVVHLKNQKITFIYDINHTNFQPLVSPYPLQHEILDNNSKIYNAQFISKRALLSDGTVAKWRMNIGVIYHYLKNQMSIFEFLNRRRNSKMQLIRWMRQGIFNFKPINLSKMWKSIFYKIQTGLHDQSQILSLIEIYSNIFYILSIDPLIPKQHLANSLIECIRQANQYQLPIPDLLQVLTTELLIQTQKFDLLAYLCYQDVIKSEQKVYRIIFEKAEKEKDELLLTLSIDLAYQIAPSKQVLKMILKSQRIKQGKRFVKHNHEKMQVLDFLEVAQYIKNYDLKREYISYVKSFILHKYPQTNPIYLQQAEKKLIG